MSRKHKHEDHVNHEAWAVPYGDLVTLLLAFFVVMYAVSSINEGKYRVLADSLVSAFRGPPRSMEPIQVGHFLSKADEEVPTGLPRTMVPMETDRTLVPALPGAPRPLDLPDSYGVDGDPDEPSYVLIERLEDEVVAAMAPLIEADLIRVRRVSFWLEVEINTNYLFDSGSARVAPDAIATIERIAGLLGGTQTRIQVEGHTDTVPISTASFPSNWELSAGRAASVVRLLAHSGVDPASMAAVGYGEFRPVTDNGTAEGRRQNRRVVIVVMSGNHAPAREHGLSGAPATAGPGGEVS